MTVRRVALGWQWKALGLEPLAKRPHLRGWETRGEERYNAKLTEAVVRALKTDHRSGWGGYVRLARKYGLSRNTVREIIKGKRWKHVTI